MTNSFGAYNPGPTAYPETLQLINDLEKVLQEQVLPDQEIKVTDLFRDICDNFLEVEHDVIGEYVDQFEEQLTEFGFTLDTDRPDGSERDLRRRKEELLQRIMRLTIVDMLTAAFIAVKD